MWKEEPVLRGPTQKPSMNFRNSPQEMGNRSSPNLANPPFEIGNRSPPPLNQYPSGSLSPPRQSSPYLNSAGASSSRLNISNVNVGGTQNPSMNSGLDFQGLHTQSPPPTTPGYLNGNNDKYPAMVAPNAPNGYGNASPPVVPRNYLTGFRELP